MTSHTTLRALLAPITTREAGRITTHYETCYQWHVGCLAALVSDLLPADAEPTPVTITAEQREAAARELYEEEANDSDGFDTWPAWDSRDNVTRDIWLLRVDAMVAAMGFEVSR